MVQFDEPGKKKKKARGNGKKKAAGQEKLGGLPKEAELGPLALNAENLEKLNTRNESIEGTPDKQGLVSCERGFDIFASTGGLLLES